MQRPHIPVGHKTSPFWINHSSIIDGGIYQRDGYGPEIAANDIPMDRLTAKPSYRPHEARRAVFA